MIKSAQYIISSPDVKDCPQSTLPEYAFIGRSNVGKSSLINMLCHNPKLAKTSQKPGKTLLINHFLINDSWHLVDLPGYGYAQAGQKQREALKRMIERYCLLREQLVCLFVLVDCRHEPQKIDVEVINWLGFKQVTICNPHSTVSEALFDRVYVDFNCVYEDVKMALHFAATDRDVVLYFPDEGACKRYSDLLAPLGLPVAFGIKKRDWKTGKILGIDIAGYDDLKGKNILMVDDICAYGGTFYYSALRLKELGAKDISCYVTHLENSVMDKEKGKLIDAKWYSHDGKTSEDLIKTIYATNSIFRGTASHKIKIVREF